MIQDHSLSNILENLFHNNREIRELAEYQIKQLATNNFGLFLLDITSQLSNNNESAAVKLMCATLIKNVIHDNFYRNQWKSLDLNIKEQIRLQILATLTIPDESIRKACSLAIANICKVDLPNKEWTEIFDILIGESKNTNKTIQQTSIITLGHVFEEIQKDDINKKDIIKVFNCFTDIITHPSTHILVIEETLKSMFHFSHLLMPVMQDNELKAILFNILNQYIINRNNILQQWTIKLCMVLLRDFYEFFEFYIDNVISWSYEIMSKSNSLQNVIYCYEIWGEIGLIEINRLAIRENKQSKNFCLKAYIKLLPIMFNHLIPENYIEDEWTKSKSSSFLLEVFSQCCDILLINKVLTYVGLFINSSNSNERHAAILAFYSILETTHHYIILPIVLQSLSIFLSYLESKEEPNHIHQISANTITKITELFGCEIVKEEHIVNQLFFQFIKIIDNQSDNIKVQLCNCILYLIISIENNQNQSTNVLSHFFNSILLKLSNLALEIKAYNQINNVSLSCFFLINTLIEKAAPDSQVIIQSFFKSMLFKFENTLKVPSNEQSYNLQQLLSSLFTSCIRSIFIEEETVKQCFNLTIESFKQRKSVFEEGISLIGNIAILIGSKFESLMIIFDPFLFFAVNSVNEITLCSMSIYVLCDIIQSLGVLFSKYVQKTLNQIIQLISNPNVDKTIKLNSFNVVSDIYCFCPQEALLNFDTIMTLFNDKIQIILINDPKNEIELVDSEVDLKVKLLETISLMFTSISKVKQTKYFYPYVPSIMLFIYQINSCFSSTNDLLKYSLGLIGDFCSIYSNRMKSLIQLNNIETMIIKLNEANNQIPIKEQKENITLINWVKQQLYQFIS